MPRRRDVSSLAASLTRLKSFPGSVEAIRKLAADPGASVGALARLVEQDVGVATDLLRIANGATSALSQKCTSVRHAASLLGLRRVCALVESAAAVAVVEQAAACCPELASRVLAVAGVARMLAHIPGCSPDDVFTAALLHDVGVLLLVQSDDPCYEELFDSDGVGGEPSVNDEVALMGFDHAALGAAVVRNWNVPEPIPQVVALHHDWEGAVEAGGVVCAMVALLRVAERLVPVLKTMSEPTLDDLSPLVAEPELVHLGITRDELFRLWEGLRGAGDRASVLGEARSTEVTSAPSAPPPSLDVAPPRDVEPVAAPPWGLVGAVAAAVVAGALALVLLV